MKHKRLELIKCPECGCEYLPAEIYLPNEFLGKPSHIEKDYTGKVLDFSDRSMNLRESYICDKCGTTFKVFARVSFRTEKDEKNNFNEDYKSKIPQKLILDEGQ